MEDVAYRVEGIVGNSAFRMTLIHGATNTIVTGRGLSRKHMQIKLMKELEDKVNNDR